MTIFVRKSLSIFLVMSKHISYVFYIILLKSTNIEEVLSEFCKDMIFS